MGNICCLWDLTNDTSSSEDKDDEMILMVCEMCQQYGTENEQAGAEVDGTSLKTGVDIFSLVSREYIVSVGFHWVEGQICSKVKMMTDIGSAGMWTSEHLRRVKVSECRISCLVQIASSDLACPRCKVLFYGSIMPS